MFMFLKSKLDVLAYLLLPIDMYRLLQWSKFVLSLYYKILNMTNPVTIAILTKVSQTKKTV